MPAFVSLSCTGICGEDRTSPAGDTGTPKSTPRPPPGKIKLRRTGPFTAPPRPANGHPRGKAGGNLTTRPGVRRPPAPTPPRPQPNAALYTGRTSPTLIHHNAARAQEWSGGGLGVLNWLYFTRGTKLSTRVVIFAPLYHLAQIDRHLGPGYQPVCSPLLQTGTANQPELCL